jgi:hypothetical protein
VSYNPRHHECQHRILAEVHSIRRVGTRGLAAVYLTSCTRLKMPSAAASAANPAVLPQPSFSEPAGTSFCWRTVPSTLAGGQHHRPGQLHLLHAAFLLAQLQPGPRSPACSCRAWRQPASRPCAAPCAWRGTARHCPGPASRSRRPARPGRSSSGHVAAGCLARRRGPGWRARFRGPAPAWRSARLATAATARSPGSGGCAPSSTSSSPIRLASEVLTPAALSRSCCHPLRSLGQPLVELFRRQRVQLIRRDGGRRQMASSGRRRSRGRTPSRHSARRGQRCATAAARRPAAPGSPVAPAWSPGSPP